MMRIEVEGKIITKKKYSDLIKSRLVKMNEWEEVFISRENVVYHQHYFLKTSSNDP